MQTRVMTFTTSGLSAWEGPCIWSDTLAKLSGRLRTDSFGAPTFEGRIEYGSIGRLNLYRVEASRHRAASSVELTHATPPMIKIILQLDGHSIYEQGGERLVLSPGDCLAYDSSNPHKKTTPARSRHLVVAVPKDAVPFKNIYLDSLSAQRFSVRRGVGRVAYDLVASAFEEMRTISSCGEAALEQAILNLLYQPLSESVFHKGEDEQENSLSKQVKTLIQRNLRDPDLCMGNLASELGCSKRYLHMVFAGEGTTITDYIWTARLEQCLLELLQPSSTEQTVTDVAFSWGFNSFSHFSHAFKKRFKIPPSVLQRASRWVTSPDFMA